MKSLTSKITILLLIGLFGGTMFYVGRKSVSLPEATTATSQPAIAPEVAAEPVQPAPAALPRPVQAVPAPIAMVKESTPSEVTNSALNLALEALVSTNTPYWQKAQVWQQLRDAGQLDQALAALKQKATDNPADAAYPTALGEGFYAKLQSVYGKADSSTVAMLALQTDQNFNDALKIDPSSWEAQYVKADALSHWPAEMNKGPEVIQQLSSLIDQQDALPSQPQFAQAYVLLGDQYQKAGKTDYAQATWLLGAQKFPNDPTLQSRGKAH